MENLCIEDQSANLCVEDQSQNEDIYISWKDKNNIQQFGIIKVPVDCDHNLLAQQVRQSINDEKFTERGITIINSADIGENTLEHFQRQIEQHKLGKVGIIGGGLGHLGIGHRYAAESQQNIDTVELVHAPDAANDLKSTYMRNPAFENPPILIRNYREDWGEDNILAQPWAEKILVSKHMCDRKQKPRS